MFLARLGDHLPNQGREIFAAAAVEFLAVLVVAVGMVARFVLGHLLPSEHDGFAQLPGWPAKGRDGGHAGLTADR